MVQNIVDEEICDYSYCDKNANRACTNKGISSLLKKAED